MSSNACTTVTVFGKSAPADHLEVTIQNMSIMMAIGKLSYDFALMKRVEQFAARSLAESPENIGAAYKFAKLFNIPAGITSSLSMINRRFGWFAQTDDITILEPEQMIEALASDVLKCREVVLVDALIRWIHERPEQRTQYLKYFLRYIRAELLPLDVRCMLREEYGSWFGQDACSKFRFQRSDWNNVLILLFQDSRFQFFDTEDHRALNWNGDVAASNLPALDSMVTTMIDSKLFVCGIVPDYEFGETKNVFYEIIIDTNHHQHVVLPWKAEQQFGFGMVAIEDYIYVCGGYFEHRDDECDDDTRSRSLFRYCTYTRAWVELSPMNCVRESLSLVTHDGLIYAIGGSDGTKVHNSIERYDPQTDEWTMVLADLPITVDNSVTICEDVIYILTDRGQFYSYNPKYSMFRELESHPRCDEPRRTNIIGHENIVYAFTSNEVCYYDVGYKHWTIPPDQPEDQQFYNQNIQLWE